MFKQFKLIVRYDESEKVWSTVVYSIDGYSSVVYSIDGYSSEINIGYGKSDRLEGSIIAAFLDSVKQLNGLAEVILKEMSER